MSHSTGTTRTPLATVNDNQRARSTAKARITANSSVATAFQLNFRPKPVSPSLRRWWDEIGKEPKAKKAVPAELTTSSENQDTPKRAFLNPLTRPVAHRVLSAEPASTDVAASPVTPKPRPLTSLYTQHHRQVPAKRTPDHIGTDVNSPKRTRVDKPHSATSYSTSMSLPQPPVRNATPDAAEVVASPALPLQMPAGSASAYVPVSPATPLATAAAEPITDSPSSFPALSPLYKIIFSTIRASSLLLSQVHPWC
jgi:hypothetical protein